MANTVAQMSKQEFREMLSLLIEEKLLELFGDPDEGLEIRKTIKDRLLRQRADLVRGEQCEPFEKAIKHMGLS